MPIPEAQLETWSHQGSRIQSASTYGTIKAVLEDPRASYSARNTKVFLQGSYCNDTNIRTESDVDIVIVYQDAFFKDIADLPSDQINAFNASHSDGTYPYNDFKRAVHTQLASAFPNSVTNDVKALRIAPNDNRRSADVIVAFRYRRYSKFRTLLDENHVTGICFKLDDDTEIANYPEQHSVNCTAKHQLTNNCFKPLVRIFKNMRSKLENDGFLDPGDAPSYFIEGLLYNAPPECFSGDYQQMVLNILNWLHETTDREDWVCVNEQYYLLRNGDPVCWERAKGEKFIDAVINLWNDWE